MKNCKIFVEQKTTVNTNEEVENGAMTHGMKKTYFTSTTKHKQNRTCYLLNYKIKDFPYLINKSSNSLWVGTLKWCTSKLEIYSLR